MTIKPIPTTFKGVNFRSKLEAKWALFFDKLNLIWRYEPELNCNYKPDFWVTQSHRSFPGVYVEVKPAPVNENYLQYLADNQFGFEDSNLLIIVCGEPFKSQWDGHLLCFRDNEMQRLGGFYFAQCPNCGFIAIDNEESVKKFAVDNGHQEEFEQKGAKRYMEDRDIKLQMEIYGYCNKCDFSTIKDAQEYASKYRFDLGEYG